MTRRSLVAALTGTLLVLSSGCSFGRESPSISAQSPASSTRATSDWLAVIASSADPNDLDGPRSEIVVTLGSNDPRVVVSPGACFTGIARRYAASYVLAVTDTSRDLVEELIRQTESDAEWIGPVTSTCID
jgi:hypothetical protein